MELVRVNTKSQRLVVAPLGDLQYAGRDGATALGHVRNHIQRGIDLDAWWVGLGDYIDFLSPSNRQRLRSAALYDTADNVIDAKAHELVEELFEEVLKPTKGRWLGLLEGHHFYEGQGSTSDMWLAELLECAFLGTSCYIRLEPSGYTLWAHHGTGGGIMPAAPFNKMYHASHGWAGADIFLMGHTTRAGVVPLARPQPNWEGKRPDLIEQMIYLVSTGGFSKSSIVRHRHGRIPRGDYAEQRMLNPSPLTAPIIHLQGPRGKHPNGIRVEV